MAKEEAVVALAMAVVNQMADASCGTTKLGALLREQMNKGE
jgi:small subunit ribosomal protein S1